MKISEGYFFFHLRTETCPLHAPLPTAVKRYVKAQKKAQPKPLVIKLPPSSYFAITVQKHAQLTFHHENYSHRGC